MVIPIFYTCGVQTNVFSIIPKPVHLEQKNGKFIIDAQTKIIISSENEEVRNIGEYLGDIILTSSGKRLDIITKYESYAELKKIEFSLQSNSDLGAEGYQIKVDKDSVVLTASAPAGLFYAVQTLRQLLPAEIEKKDSSQDLNLSLPALEIEDKPRFPWRGMLLDCGRHFMSKDFVKRYIDLLAYHKMNRLHWHLTEDQGWRIEIKKYPKLTKIGSWRTYEDGSRYGGFYTQEDIKEVVDYASSRYVLVIPEIEMPGHSVAALAAYPQYSCTGGPFKVETQWGVHKDVYCAGNEATFDFLEDVLTEVLELFPSQYIHIGGDEVPKDRWRICKKCQARIKSENLKDEYELQSYFITRIEKFLLARNRRLIGWDEILEGGLAPEATVQSWRDMDGAIAAARSGNDAIVSPTSHAYFNQDITAIDLRSVYAFEPTPPGLSQEESRHILGGECTVWTERIEQERVDYMVFPRLLAMCEVLWTPKRNKDFADFYKRVREHYKRLDYLGVGYGPESRPVSVITEFDPENLRYKITLDAGEPGLKIYYTLDGSEPNSNSKLYKEPFEINRTGFLQAGAFKEGVRYGEVAKKSFTSHLASGKLVELKYRYSNKYTGGGAYGLTDGIRGSLNFRDGCWQGFEEDDFEGIIDLGQERTVNSINAGFLQIPNSWIFLPEFVEYAVSLDGKNYRVVAHLKHSVSQRYPDELIKDFQFDGGGIKVRYIRVKAKNIATCPDWHPGAGGKAWIFVDEIIVN